MTVSFHNSDFVKEITAVKEEETETVSTYDPFMTPSEKLFNDRLPYSGSKLITAISSVTYKPSDSLSSGPVYLHSSRQHYQNSHFHYIAKFHTKKHVQETDLCRLTSILALDDGQIVITDINHLQIMLFASDFTYLDSLECPSPCGLGFVSENTVAATLFHNRKIMHIKVHMLHLERQKELHIPCQEPLFAVTYRCGCHFVLCSAGDIHTIDDDGKQTGIIATGIHNGEARFMDVSQDTKRILVSGTDRVVCFSDTGEKLWQYKSRDSHKRFTPGDILLYHERIFVADWSGNKVLELSSDGSYVRDVVSDNIESPHAIAIQHKYGRMLISQSNFFKQEARSRSIKVFEIK